MGEAVNFIEHIHGDAMTKRMIIRGSLNADHVIVHSGIIGEKFSSPDLGYSLCCLLGEKVIVLHYLVEAKGLVILDAFLYREVGGEVSCSSPVELSLGSLPVEVASYCWLHHLPQLIVDVQEGGTLRAERPFMKVAEIGIGSYVGDIKLDISRGVSTVNYKNSAFFLEELSESLDWQGCACD
jgi:hypothetical protein